MLFIIQCIVSNIILNEGVRIMQEKELLKKSLDANTHILL